MLFESLKKSCEETEKERVHRLVAEHFEKKYSDFESFKKDVYEKIERGLKDIEEGRCQTLEDFCAEMEAKYHINE